MTAVVLIGIDPEAVREDTWGHLRPRPDVWHPGVIVFAESAFDGRVILHADFGDAVPDSPWFYEQLHEWLDEQDAETGRLYTFTGRYRTGRSDAYEFRGEITCVPLLTAAGRALLDTLNPEGH